LTDGCVGNFKKKLIHLSTKTDQNQMVVWTRFEIIFVKLLAIKMQGAYH
jgi:hypothetical protein